MYINHSFPQTRATFDDHGISQLPGREPPRTGSSLGIHLKMDNKSSQGLRHSPAPIWGGWARCKRFLHCLCNKLVKRKSTTCSHRLRYKVLGKFGRGVIPLCSATPATVPCIKPSTISSRPLDRKEVVFEFVFSCVELYSFTGRSVHGLSRTFND